LVTHSFVFFPQDRSRFALNAITAGTLFIYQSGFLIILFARAVAGAAASIAVCSRQGDQKQTGLFQPGPFRGQDLENGSFYYIISLYVDLRSHWRAETVLKCCDLFFPPAWGAVRC
jgi:hypothetical protein